MKLLNTIVAALAITILAGVSTYLVAGCTCQDNKYISKALKVASSQESNATVRYMYGDAYKANFEECKSNGCRALKQEIEEEFCLMYDRAFHLYANRLATEDVSKFNHNAAMVYHYNGMRIKYNCQSNY